MRKRICSVTLLELLIAITLLSVIVIGFFSIDMFSRYHVLTADRRAQVQNEASFALEHMSKNIVRAIGNERLNGENTVVAIADKEATGGGEKARIKIYIDASGDGIRQDEKNNPDVNEDHWIAYRYYDNNHSDVTKRNRIEFCSRCRNKPCNTCCKTCTTATDWETVSLKANQVSGLFPIKPGGDTLTDNYVEVSITARWNPAQAASSDNPEVTMSTRIKMPSVSTN